jgi:hypothetical protein
MIAGVKVREEKRDESREKKVEKRSEEGKGREEEEGRIIIHPTLIDQPTPTPTLIRYRHIISYQNKYT